MRRKIVLSLAVFAALTGAYGSAQATSGPGCFTVANVAYWDVLNVRAKPRFRSRIVDVLKPGRHGIIARQGWCQPRSRNWKSRWCPIKHYDGDRVTSGWVKRRYLSPSDCP